MGHRKRLRKRFLEGGRSAVADYELLELVLFRAMPQRDMKPTAKAVLARFGTFSEALNAPDRELMTINGIGEAAIAEFRIVRAAALQFLRDEVVERPLLTSWDGVLDYCRASMSYESREQFRVIFLDKRNRIITDEVQQVGTVDHTPVYTREVMKRALELSATALILVHNHPSGDPEPSRADIAMTKLIADTAKNLGIVIHDHIVIGREGHVSFKAKGLL
ncbi:MAG: DNA repair protein RadC [Pseudomonadota bacterium]